jgi:putative transposase
MSKDNIINRENFDWLLEQPMNVQLEVMQHHLDVMKIAINSLLESEVESLAGKPYSRGHDYHRWGVNPGSVRVGAQKIPVEVPRVQEKASGKFGPLPIYEQLRELPDQSREMVESVLHGLSMRDYGKVTDQLFDSFGLSPASLSHEFKQHTEQALEAFYNRRFEDEPYVGLFIDGKSLAGEQMIVVLGIGEHGGKRVLNLVQSHTENGAVCAEMLQELVDRGLKYQQGLLVVIDGGKGIRKAVTDVFGNKAIVQRCRWHKRENVIKYLNENDQETYKRKLQQAYQEDDYNKAHQALMLIGNELKLKNIRAYNSLQEGLEETLTLQKLGVNQYFGKSFGTTNCIESLNSQITKYTRNVKRWTNSWQRHRWVIAALMEAEKRMKKVFNSKKLHLLTQALEKETKFDHKPEPEISTKN